MAEETIKQTTLLEGVLGEVRKLNAQISSQNVKETGEGQPAGLPPGSAQFIDAIENLEKSNADNAEATQEMMQDNIDATANSASKERESSEKRERTFARIGEGLKNVGSSLREKAADVTSTIFGKIPLNTLFGLGVMALIGFLNNDQWKAIGTFVADAVKGLKGLYDTVSGLVTTITESETFKGIKQSFSNLFTKIEEYLGPEVTEGILNTLKALGLALGVAFLFAPFKTAGLLVKGTFMLGKLLLKPITALAGAFKSLITGTSAAAATASKTAGTVGAATKASSTKLNAVAKTVGTVKGGEKVVKSASGKLSIAGADGKATARMVDPSDVRRTKVSQVAGAVKDKFSHLKAFPKLATFAKKIPFIGAALSAGLLVQTLLDDSLSKEEKIKAVGGALGGILGGVGGAKLGALAGALGGPIGALVGAAGGGLLGYFGGEYIGMSLAEFLMNNKQPERPKVTARGGHARRNQIKAQKRFDAQMAEHGGDQTGGAEGGETATPTSKLDSSKMLTREQFYKQQGVSDPEEYIKYRENYLSTKQTPESITPKPAPSASSTPVVNAPADNRSFNNTSSSNTVVSDSITNPAANQYGFMNNAYPAT